MIGLQPVKVLLIEDNLGDVRLIHERLAGVKSASFEIEHQETLEAGLARMAAPGVDVLLLDLNLPDSHDLETLERTLPLARKIPVIVLTGLDDEELGIKAVREGAQDYLVKRQVDGDLLARTIRYAIERKRVEVAWQESGEYFESLIENSNDVFTVITAEGIILHISPSVKHVSGYEPEELIGKTAFDFIHPEDVPLVVNTIAEGIAIPGFTALVEFRWRRKDGSWMIQEAVGKNLLHDPVVAGIVINSRDITERKRMEEGLRVINQELDAYAHMVSHDLKSPLAVIVSAVETITEMIGEHPEWGTEVEGGELAGAVEIIAKGIERMDALIGDALTLAEAGQVPQDACDVSVTEVVREILDERAVEISEREIEVVMDEDMGRLQADTIQIYQLFGNLIGNAIKHNLQSDLRLEIRYKGADFYGVHHYLVRDNGQGIREENLEKVFLPFFKEEYLGTGLGLAIVRKLVGVYGGEIKAYNDGGACFEFTLRDWH
jgi:PAS domain S-box-containing protein